MQKTFIAKPGDIQRKCYLIDASGKVLGHLAAKAATILRGKHKTIYTPNIDCGDTVIVINAAKIQVTGKKLTDKLYFHYSGYPGGLKPTSLENMLKKSPERVIELAVNRMIPSGALGSKMRKKLKVYKGDKHPHQTQQLIPLAV